MNDLRKHVTQMQSIRCIVAGHQFMRNDADEVPQFTIGFGSTTIKPKFGGFMRLKFVAAALLLLCTAAPALAQTAPSTDLSKAPSGPLEMDTRHTQVVFTIVRGGLINVYGRFDKNSGTLNFDTAKPENSQLNVTIDMTSISMMVPALNTMLQGKDVMDTADFPAATFKSTSVVRTGPNAGNVTGDMTFRGKTKPVTFAVVYNGSNGDLVGFHATATLKRSDFGMTEMRFNSLISDGISLIIEGQFQKPRGSQ